jgi:flagellar hook-associated protein 2
LATPTATSSDVGKVSVLSTDGSALSGIYEFSVSALATEQRNISNAYLSKTQSLNGGSGFTLTVTTPAGGTATNIAIDAGNDNPQGVVNAINAAGLGVTAVLVAADSAGSAYRIALQGQTGASNSFEISSTLSDSDLGFHDASNGNLANNSGTRSLQNPGDASLTYNGVGLTRSSNVVTDVLPGLTVSLNGTTSGGDTVNLNVVSDRATLKTKLQDLVTTYNDVQFALNELSDPDSEEEEVGGALARDLAVIRTVRDTIYKAVTQDSSTPSGDITGLRDIGVTLTGYGELQFSETAYDAKASANFSDISTMLSAGTDNQSRYDGQSQGLAIDAIAKLEVLTDSIDGIFAQRTESARKELSTYSKELIDLEARMDALYERYLSQFTVMETLVKQLNSTRESLTDTWSNMGNFNK